MGFEKVPYFSEVKDWVDNQVSDAATSLSELDTKVSSLDDTVDTHDHSSDSDGSQIPDDGLVEDYVTNAESSTYTDSDAVDAVDAEVDMVSDGVSGMDSLLFDVAGNQTNLLTTLEMKPSEQFRVPNYTNKSDIINTQKEEGSLYWITSENQFYEYNGSSLVEITTKGLPTASEGDSASETGVLAYDPNEEQLLISK